MTGRVVEGLSRQTTMEEERGTWIQENRSDGVGGRIGGLRDVGDVGGELTVVI